MRKKTMISLDEKMMERLDHLAKETHRTRSGMIAFLVSLFRPGKWGAVKPHESLYEDNDAEP